jgi:hypothetical protein
VRRRELVSTYAVYVIPVDARGVGALELGSTAAAIASHSDMKTRLVTTSLMR